jgi:hypothetical protein
LHFAHLATHASLSSYCISLYILAHFFAPLIPDAVAAIEVKLGTRLGTLPGLRVSWDNLSPGTLVDPRAILFAKIASAP